jgi:hypothetical protein
MSDVVELLPSQAVYVYGWKMPLRIINWKSVCERTDLTFRKLWSIGLDEKQLYTLQPDKHLWISTKKIVLADVGLVPDWKIHVVNDLIPKATIVDIAQQNLSADFLLHTGVTFTDLVSAGLTLNMMLILKFKLESWIHLGLYQDFLKDLTDLQSVSMFDMPKSYVMLCVKETPAKRKTIDSESNA